MHFTSIVLSGGHFEVVSAAGCVKALLEKQSFDLIKTFVGTSAGALMCAALCAGFSPQETIDFLLTSLKDPKISQFDSLEVLDILDTYGCFSGNNLDVLINKLLNHKGFNKDTTFMEFTKATGKNLVVCASNLTRERSEFFCIDNTPNMPLSIALRISCTIPILFAPIKYAECLYVDGMLYNNFPINYLESNLKDIFAVNIYRSSLGEATSFMKYMYNIVFSLQRTITNNNLKTAPQANIITIDMEYDDASVLDLDSFNVAITKEYLESKFNRGYELAKLKL